MCSQCIKSKRKCLGYRDLSDFYFRDETLVTKFKASRTRYSRQSKELSTRSLQDHGSTERTRPELGIQNVAAWSADIFDTILRSLLESWQQAAICFFLPNFVEARSPEESSRGFMIYLPPLYIDAKPDSTISVATSALSLGALAGATRRFDLLSKAMKQYGMAMVRMNRALIDPSEAKSDATLLSVLIFAIFEDFTCSIASLPSRGKHYQGAMALIKNRGKEILQNPRSLKLFNTVHYRTIVSQIFLCKPVNTLEFMITIEDWSEFPALEKEKAANRLTLLTLKLPNLRASAQRTFSVPQCNEKSEMVKDLMRDATVLGQSLSTWPCELPESWRLDTVAYINELDTVETAEAYYGPIHKYPDLWVAFTYNKWRICMIFIQAIILNCAEWLSSTSSVIRPELGEARIVLQTMVNEICASIPFHLGIKSNKTCEKAFIDPHIVARFAQKLGGYYLIWPIFVAGSVSCIPKTQRIWLKHRLAHIGQREGQGKTQARVLAELTPYSPCSGLTVSVTDFLHTRADPIAEASELLSS